jgi:hypothetical protein
MKQSTDYLQIVNVGIVIAPLCVFQITALTYGEIIETIMPGSACLMRCLT